MVESNSEITKPIGGYFELADRESADNFPHKDGILLNTGRNALEYILRSIKDIKSIYLPYFTCEVVLEPIKKLGIPYNFYNINPRFEIADRIILGEGDYIIVNNYYGIKDLYIRSLYARYGDHLIVDCAQAFFAPVVTGIKAFYSCRKFVGVADGGIAYLGNEIGADDRCLKLNRLKHTLTTSSSARRKVRRQVSTTIRQTKRHLIDNQSDRCLNLQRRLYSI